MSDIQIPDKYSGLVGTKQIFSGGLFSSKKEEEPLEYDVLDWRWGSGKVIDKESLRFMHPTVEFLIKREGMRASRWTRGFPVPEITLEDQY